MSDKCEAAGEGWDCDKPAETQMFGRLCVSHYNQANRGTPLRAVRRRPSRDEMFAGCAAVMREAGWKVTAPR